jgi:hypothetical protein
MNVEFSLLSYIFCFQENAKISRIQPNAGSFELNGMLMISVIS